jgi:hypothetical protein
VEFGSVAWAHWIKPRSEVENMAEEMDSNRFGKIVLKDWESCGNPFLTEGSTRLTGQPK